MKTTMVILRQNWMHIDVSFVNIIQARFVQNFQARIRASFAELPLLTGEKVGRLFLLLVMKPLGCK